MEDNRCRILLDRFLASVSDDIELYSTQKRPLLLPAVPKIFLNQLIQKCTGFFQSEPSLLDIESPCTIIGDIHGHVLDLLRILKTFGYPEENSSKFVFLGDLVDRGEFSVETITIVYLLKAIWPTQVFVIRGNHEFDFLSSQCGFQRQVLDSYNNDMTVYQAFLNSFSYISLGVRIDNKMLCVHGGIGPSMFSVKQIVQLEKPINEFGDEVIDALLWSDPSDTTENFEPSTRGTGFFFSKAALSEFLDLSNLEILIRAHECVMEGFEVKFGNKLITVFSASNYCGIVKNNAAVIKVTGPMNFDFVKFPPLEYLKRQVYSSRGNAGGLSNELTKFPSISVDHPQKISFNSKTVPSASSFRSIPGLRDVNLTARKLPVMEFNTDENGSSLPLLPGASTNRRMRRHSII